MLWDSRSATIILVNFEQALTFNNLGAMVDPLDTHISRTLPSRYQTWSNGWYTEWGLSRDMITPFCKGTDGTVFANDGWAGEYASEVVREPKMPTLGVGSRLVATDIEENRERREYALQLEVFRAMKKTKCAIM
jgi:hypothetical protein